MKKFIYLIVLQFSTVLVFAQCAIEPWSLEKRINKSTLVIEGKVISKEGVWNKDKGNIYTINTVEVYKIFKGSITAGEVRFITLGGTVGLDMVIANPSLELNPNETGVFLLKENPIELENQSAAFMPTASTQSFIKYNLRDVIAFDRAQNYTSINNDLYEEIKSTTKENFEIVEDFDAEASHKKIKALANPVISSFSVDTLSSGTETVLTINGSNFGFARGNGKVGFKDANFGDGRFYYPPIDWSYQSWSNSKIEIKVPSRAGTGVVEVTNTLGENGKSTDDLFVKWAHSNILYPLSSNDTQFFKIDHVNDNSSGGYSWQMTNNFASNSGAVGAFTRSLEEWRCETQMNWDIDTNTSIDALANDNVNIVRFTNFGDSKLGVCYSRYSGCFYNGGNNINWYVKELDIEFDSTYNWYFGTSSPNSNQYDFQSVTTHELGHGHQLGHVRDASKVMHYSLSNGVRKPDLVASDIEGGNYVKSKSIASSPCGPSPMQSISANACTLTPPETDFTISDAETCPGANVSFTDNTIGAVTSYTWSFGDGASLASANSMGPHTVAYSSSGIKVIKLITSNLIGNDTLTKTVLVKVNALDQPNSFKLKDSFCLGEEVYKIEPIENAESYEWTVSSGGAIVGSNSDTSIKVNWTENGNFEISVLAKNECTTSAAITEQLFVVKPTESTFNGTTDGTSIVFTNTSTDAETFEWSFGDGKSSTEESPTHMFPDKGEYTVKLKTTNLCSNDEKSETFNLSFKAGIDELSGSLVVYPNPVKTGQNIVIKGVKPLTYKLLTLKGEVLVDGVTKTGTVTMPNISPSIYILNIVSENKSTNIRLKILE